MPRASTPHSPAIDLAARRDAAAVAGPAVVLTPELQAFCASGVSVIVAASLRGEPPIAGLGCGSRILADGRMRLLLPEPGNEALLAVVARGGGIAATFSQPLTHRSIQVKASEATIVETTDEDRREAARQCEGLRRDLVDVNYPPAFAAAYCTVVPDSLAALDFAPEAAFVQTPGPGAGAELRP